MVPHNRALATVWVSLILLSCSTKISVNFHKGCPHVLFKPSIILLSWQWFASLKEYLGGKTNLRIRSGSVLGHKCFCCIGTTCVIGHEKEWGQGTKKMNINFPPESLLNQRPGQRMSWQLQLGLRKRTPTIPWAVRNIFHLKTFFGPTPKSCFLTYIMTFLTGVLRRLSIYYSLMLLFFFFYGKHYSSFSSHKTSREVSIWSRLLILRTAVVFF